MSLGYTNNIKPAINRLEIKNFRVFNGQYKFDFNPITILTGTNSSGKSSLTKAMLLIKSMLNKNKEDEKNPFKLFFQLDKDDNLNIGNFDNWLNEYRFNEAEISFSFPFSFIGVLDNYTLETSYVAEDNVRRTGRLSKIRIFNNSSKEDIFLLDDKQIKFDLPELWGKLDKYNTFLNKFNFFINEITPVLKENYPWLIVEHQIYTPEGPDSYIIDESRQFLLSILGQETAVKYYETEVDFDDDKELIKKDQIIELLNKEQKDLFEELESNVVLLKSNSPNGHLNIEDLNRKINTNFPLFTYNLVESNISRKDNELFEWLKNQQNFELKALQILIEDHSLINILNHTQNSNLQSNSDLLFQMLGEISNNLIWRTVTQDDSQLNILSTLGYINYLNINFPNKELILSNNDESEYIKKYNKFFPNYLFTKNLNNEIEKVTQNHLKYFITEIVINSFVEGFKKIFNEFNNINFIPAIRNPQPERFYISKGQINYFSDIIIELNKLNSEERDKAIIGLKAIIKIIGIADEARFINTADDSITQIFLEKQGKRKNLADFGHGISQLLPVLLKLSLFHKNETQFSLYNKLIIIEEPETNLHPALQSKLADIFLYFTKKYRISFIIETHSEYLIRKLQYLTAKMELESKHTSIYYFYHPDDIPEGEDQIKKINITKTGGLTDTFGDGFYDESDNLAIQLYDLRNKIN